MHKVSCCCCYCSLVCAHGHVWGCAADHWNPTVHSLAEGVLKHYSDRDPDLYERCLAAFPKEEEHTVTVKDQRKRQWEALEKLVA